MGGQNCGKIEIVGVFWGMLFETLLLVEFCWIFDKNDGAKHMDFQLIFEASFRQLFLESADFFNARDLNNSDCS